MRSRLFVLPSACDVALQTRLSVTLSFGVLEMQNGFWLMTACAKYVELGATDDEIVVELPSNVPGCRTDEAVSSNTSPVAN